MGESTALVSSSEFRRKLRERGGASVSRCYQCATCSTACELATADRPFPRRQMQEAQWGLSDRLMADPAVWLCHQCNDCSARCPRDARPGDVMAQLRALTVEALATPKLLGQLVGDARRTWPLLLGIPILFWIGLLWLTTGLHIPEGVLVYGDFVSHGHIYAVYFATAAFVLVTFGLSGWRFWQLLGAREARRGSFLSALWPALGDIVTHSRFEQCGEAKPRRWGHWALLWGFVGAAVTSGLIIVAMYGLGQELPLPQAGFIKILGNVSAVALVVGGLMLLANRLEDAKRTGATSAFDAFFLGIVLLVVFTGVVTELGRYLLPNPVACGVYVVHLGAVLCLFLTTPYSKFAHLVYRTLAMVHERMAGPPALPAATAGDASSEPDTARSSDDE
jgi:quinone-modifying oxidoreductase subunit QmoC